MNNETVGIISIVIWEVLLGFTPLIYKLMSADIPSSLIVAIRFGLGSVVIFTWLFMSGNMNKYFIHWTWKKLAGMMFLGVLGSGVASLWNVVAVRHVGVVLSSLLTNLELPLGVFLGYLALSEHITKIYLKVAAIIFLGFVLLTVKNGITLPSGGSYLIGATASLGAAMIWGACTVVGKKLTFSVAPSTVASARLFLGALTNLMIALGGGIPIVAELTTISPKDWIYLVWLGVVTSGIGFVLFYQGLQVLPVKKISLFFLVAPVISVLLGTLTGETPLFSQWVGIGLILGGISFLLLKKEHV